MAVKGFAVCIDLRRPLREGVGRNHPAAFNPGVIPVALYARAWVEMVSVSEFDNIVPRRPLREGVGRNHVE